MTLAGSGTIDSVSLFDFDTGGDQIFNNLSISSTSLVPPDINLVAPTNGTIYWPSASGLSFNVVSAFSTVSSNNIKLYLNGASRTNLSFAGQRHDQRAGDIEFRVAGQHCLYRGHHGQRCQRQQHDQQFQLQHLADQPLDLYIEAEDYNYSSGELD